MTGSGKDLKNRKKPSSAALNRKIGRFFVFRRTLNGQLKASLG
jgi:hypothetical protein